LPILITLKLYSANPQLVINLIEELAKHNDWEVREEAATVLKRLKKKYFDELYPVMERWVKGDNPYLKRAVSVALIQRFPKEEENLEKIFSLFESIIRCDNPYVRKNCGPFGLAAIFRRYPEKTEEKIYYWSKKYSSDETVLWNMIMVFSQANAKYYPREGRRILARIKPLAGSLKLSRVWQRIEKKLKKFA